MKLNKKIFATLIVLSLVLSFLSPVFASTEPGHTAACAFAKEVACTVWKPAGEGCFTGGTHTGQICNFKAEVPCATNSVEGHTLGGTHTDGVTCTFEAAVACTVWAPAGEGHTTGGTHTGQICNYKAAVACDKGCLDVVTTFKIRIPVTFKPEKDSAKAPNNTKFKFDYTLGKDSNFASTSYITGGGYGGGGFGGGGYGGGGFGGGNRGGGRRAPGSYFDHGYDCFNGVASGYIEIVAEPGNYVLTVSRVVIKGYTINPASITIRFTILDNGKVRFNTNAQRADFTYVKDGEKVVKKVTDNPKTADLTNIALWGTLAPVCAAGFVFISRKAKKVN
ncbi:MAG: hypothetical protein FWG10_09130 [Eubacteriaceae bacterium]|nr:hypothetical protein [Eubacteriaceae bacterium]